MLILFKRRVNSEPLISTRIKRRRLFTVITLAFLLLFSSLLVTSKYYNTPTKATTWDSDNLVIGLQNNMYIGAGGFVSRRYYSNVGYPEVGTEDRLNVDRPIPADNIYTSENVQTTTNCPPDRPGMTPPTTCNYILSSGGGMVIRFNNKIEINGTLYIGDRVILEAPEIIIGSSGKILANGQDGMLGNGDSCGAGGIGGTVGGTAGGKNADSTLGGTKWIACDWNALWGTKFEGSTRTGLDGWPGSTLLATPENLNSPISEFFTSGGQTITGGSAGSSSDAYIMWNGQGHGSSLGLSGTIGVGGAGPSGGIGNSGGDDHGSSGGGGGGFGIVFKAKKLLKIWTGAQVTAHGGNTIVNKDGYPQFYNHNENATGGFGGPGGGGVIIIDTPNIVFSNYDGGVEAADVPNYNVFDVSSGKLVSSGVDPFDGKPESVRLSLSELTELNQKSKLIVISPGHASPGALVIKSSSYSKISKQVTPLNVNPGDDVTVTLTVPVALGVYDVEDEFLNDGNGHYFTLSGILPPGCTSDAQKLSCPNTTTTPIVYHLKAPIN